MNTYQHYLDRFNQFCNSVMLTHISEATSPRSLQNFMDSLKQFPDKIKSMEREMVAEANRILHECLGNSEIDYEIIKNDLIDTAKSYILQSGSTM